MADQPIYYPHGQQNNIGDSFMRAFMTGLQMRQQQQEEAAREERKFRIEALQQEAKRLKLQDKMQAFQLMQGQKAPTGMSESVPNLFSAGGQMGAPEEGQHPAIDFSEELGVPGMSLRPQNMTEMLRQALMQRQREIEAKVAEAEMTEQAKIRAQMQPVEADVTGLGPVSAPASTLGTAITQLFGQQGQAADRQFRAG